MILDFASVSIMVLVAAITAINPGLIGLYASHFSAVVGKNHSTGKFARRGLMFVLGFWASQALVGLGLIWVLSELTWQTYNYLAIIFACVLAIIGVLEIKDYFWYGKGVTMRLSKSIAKQIHRHSLKKDSLRGSFLVGSVIFSLSFVFVNLPFLGALMALNPGWQLDSIILVALYSAVFMLPALAVLALVSGETKVTTVARWKESHKAEMRLVTGLVLTGISWVLLLIASEAVSIGGVA